MRRVQKTDVVVVGAGPVGLFSALCLKRQGLDVEIFDTLPRASTHSYALALHPDTLALFKSHGLHRRIENRCKPVSKLAIHQGREQVGVIDLAVIDLKYPFIAVLPQSELEDTLIDALRAEGVSVHWSHRVSQIERRDRSVQVVVSELEERTLGYAVGHSEQFVRKNHLFEAAFLVGADGNDSIVRRHLEIDFPEMAPARRFAVFEFTGQGIDDDSMQLFSKDGLTSWRWPVRENSWRWSFEVGEMFPGNAEKRRKDPELVQLEDSNSFAGFRPIDLQELIRDRAPWCSMAIGHLYWRVLLWFEKRMVSRFGEGRIWLAGDAAHLAGPAGVQSMNVGLREAEDLAARIAAVIFARAAIETFSEYNRERYAEWQFLLGLSGRLRAGNSVDPGLAALADDLRNWLPASGPCLVAMAKALGFEVEGMPGERSRQTISLS